MSIIEGMNIPDKAETVAFLSALIRPPSKNGETMIDCESAISPEENMLIFSKTPDKTACGPAALLCLIGKQLAMIRISQRYTQSS